MNQRLREGPTVAASSEGLNLDDIESTSVEEIDAALSHVWSWRGPQYEMYAMSLYLDYAPDFAKLTRWTGSLFGRISGEANVVIAGCQNVLSYMMTGWETGLRSQFNSLRRRGMSKEQILELVMFSQFYTGMRGLGHVYHAVGDSLPAWGLPERSVPFPDGWAPDPAAFACGLDLSTRELTDADEHALRAWYEQTIGYVPNSIKFGLKYSPRFVKLNRARWERTLKTLPKQLAPFLMLRHNLVTGSVEGLRESALLAQAWGMSADHVVFAVTNTAMYCTGFEGLYAAHAALGELLRTWDDRPGEPRT
jgi:hypothetical protein